MRSLECEIPRCNVQVLEQLGKGACYRQDALHLAHRKNVPTGNFGTVHRVRVAQDPDVPTGLYAAKMLSAAQVTDDLKLEFLQEAAIQSQFDHQNVVAVVATVIADAPMLIILELCGQGELLDMLRKTPAPELHWQLSMARDVACGMAYLHSKSFLHRDLAVTWP